MQQKSDDFYDSNDRLSADWSIDSNGEERMRWRFGEGEKADEAETALNNLSARSALKVMSRKGIDAMEALSTYWKNRADSNAGKSLFDEIAGISLAHDHGDHAFLPG